MAADDLRKNQMLRLWSLDGIELFLCMSDQESDDDQIKRRMDAMLRRLLTTPPKSRAELAEELRRAKRGKATQAREKRASAEKREGAA